MSIPIEYIRIINQETIKKDPYLLSSEIKNKTNIDISPTDIIIIMRFLGDNK